MKVTPLTSSHRSRHAKLVDFAGWLMPMHYTGVLDEYHAVRQAVGLFDVSHMGRLHVSGIQAEAFLQWISTNDVRRLEVGQAQYSMVCREDGGILDDIFVYKTGAAQFLVCVNASNRGKILEWFRHHQVHTFPDVLIRDDSPILAQIAIQGPASSSLMRQILGSSIDGLKPRRCMEISRKEWSGLLSRTGYTGEIGYEWYLPTGEAEPVWEALMEAGAEYGVKPAGLGARDLLRLDVGYLLYGNDMDERVSPLEANALGIVAWEKGEFQGKTALLKRKAKGLIKQLIGFELLERGIPRHDMAIIKNGESVGVVTSGNFSPALQKGIGMGYVPPDLSLEDTRLHVDIRGKMIPAKIVTPPFYKRPKL